MASERVNIGRLAAGEAACSGDRNLERIGGTFVPQTVYLDGRVRQSPSVRAAREASLSALLETSMLFIVAKRSIKFLTPKTFQLKT